jgi:DegV family protein with EDD domain
MMGKIAIITDTDASLSNEIAKQMGVYLVPIVINFGNESYKVGEEIDDKKLFQLIDKHGDLPSTAAPSPGDFTKTFQKAFDDGADEIICICVASTISATYSAALLAKDHFEGKQIHIIDSRTLTMGQGFMVKQAVEMVRSGASAQEIITELESYVERLHIFAYLATLKYLAMGGRVSSIQAGMADTLNIKPILTVNDGKLEMLEKIRTTKKSYARMIEVLVDSIGDKKIQKIGIMHVVNPEGVQKVQELLFETMELPVQIEVVEFTPGLSVHGGLGFVGVVALTE